MQVQNELLFLIDTSYELYTQKTIMYSYLGSISQPGLLNRLKKPKHGPAGELEEAAYATPTHKRDEMTKLKTAVQV